MSLPLGMKIRRGSSKWILREVLYKHVPKRLIDRPKMGFAIPLGKWMVNPMREWAESLISERRLKEEGFLEHREISEIWKQQLSGRQNRTNELWNILMFQAWLENQ